ncbi:hypothetical protein [Cupriavidus sp. IDO]|uniref:hypothetical protein n=1 Tax=Cupriavidus sp. IDO TaxID=1539142 RepID=UPI00187CE5F0|nr:hypothetical protein [Cupriavidus sp. IDO]
MTPLPRLIIATGQVRSREIQEAGDALPGQRQLAQRLATGSAQACLDMHFAAIHRSGLERGERLANPGFAPAWD